MRNVKLIYLLSFLFESWFWFGIWIFYYLRFTDYAGIGLAQAVMITTRTLTEIPTGALADLLGKKNIIIIAFFISTIGNGIIGFAPDFLYLVIGIIITTLSGSFYSGSHEALLYDSLYKNGKSNYFPKAITHVRSLKLIAHATAGVIGGFIYLYNPRLPFLLVSVFAFIGFVFSFLLYQPKIVEKITFNLNNMIQQSKLGLKELFTAPVLKTYIGIYLVIGFFTVIMYEILDDSLAVAYNFKPNELAILWTVVSIIIALISQITPFFFKKFHSRRGVFIIGLTMVPLLLISPYVTFIIGGVVLTLRIICQVIYHNMKLITINKYVASKYRATAISSFVMLENIPYVFSAIFIGKLIDSLGAPHFAFYMGIVLFFFIAVYFFITNSRNNRLAQI